MIRWKLGALFGWMAATLMGWTAVKMAGELREAEGPCPTEGRSREACEVEPRARPTEVVPLFRDQAGSSNVSAIANTPPPDLPLLPILLGGDARMMGEGLAHVGSRLVLMGYEDQAVHLFTASGELLDATDAA